MIIETAESGLGIRERCYVSPAVDKKPGFMTRRYKAMLASVNNRRGFALPTLAAAILLNMTLLSAVTVVNYSDHLHPADESVLSSDS